MITKGPFQTVICAFIVKGYMALEFLMSCLRWTYDSCNPMISFSISLLVSWSWGIAFREGSISVSAVAEFSPAAAVLSNPDKDFDCLARQNSDREQIHWVVYSLLAYSALYRLYKSSIHNGSYKTGNFLLFTIHYYCSSPICDILNKVGVSDKFKIVAPWSHGVCLFISGACFGALYPTFFRHFVSSVILFVLSLFQ